MSVSAPRMTFEAAGLMDRLVQNLTHEDFARPTPCDGWTVRDLLEHQVGQTAGMAEALLTGDASLPAYQSIPFSQECWRAGLGTLHQAHLQTTTDTLITQRELSRVPVTRSFVWRALAIDFAVHSWDLAVAIGHDLRPSPPLSQFVLLIAQSIGDQAHGPGAPFANVVEGLTGEPFTDTLRLCGRDPERFANISIATSGAPAI